MKVRIKAKINGELHEQDVILTQEQLNDLIEKFNQEIEEGLVEEYTTSKHFNVELVFPLFITVKFEAVLNEGDDEVLETEFSTLRELGSLLSFNIEAI